MITDVICNLCKKDNYAVLFPATVSKDQPGSYEYSCTNNRHGEYYRIVRCRHCGLIYSSPRPNRASLEENYGLVEDKIYSEEIEGRRRTFQRNLSRINRYKKAGSLLDIGCSIGVFLDEAKKRGWDAQGIEPSEWCVQECRRLFHISPLKGTTRDLIALNKKFDVITMWDVLEHLDDPLEALQSCANALNNDGLLVFSTVDIGSWYAKVLGSRWPWLMAMHIYYFDRKTIQKYLKKAGLRLVKIEIYKHTISLDYLLFKLQNIQKQLFCLTNFFKKAFLSNKNAYVTVGMGDFMTIYAKKDV